jgi:hypothetical protein
MTLVMRSTNYEMENVNGPKVESKRAAKPYGGILNKHVSMPNTMRARELEQVKLHRFIG